MASAVSIEFAVHGACDAALVGVYWLNGGEEKWYHDIPRGGRVRQATFVEHVWVSRDKASGALIDRYTATGAAHQLRMIGAPAGHLSSSEGRDGAAGAAPASDAAAEHAAPIGRAEWSADGFRFVREEGHLLWRELDSAGTESTVLMQMRAECGTSWLWWLNLAWTHFHRLDANQQAVLGSLAFVASAQQHSLPRVPWPVAWLQLARAARLPPGTLLVLVIFALGVMVAAAVPLMHRSVLLRDEQTGRMLKLGDKSVHMKAEHANAPWRELARGQFTRAPDELKVRSSHRLAHAIAVGAVAVLAAGLYSKHSQLHAPR